MSAIAESQTALVTFLKQAKLARSVVVYSNKLDATQVRNQRFQSDALYVAVLGLTAVEAEPRLQRGQFGIYAPFSHQRPSERSLTLLEKVQTVLVGQQIAPFVQTPRGFKQQRFFVSETVVIWGLLFEWVFRIGPLSEVGTMILKRHDTIVRFGQ